MKVDRVIGAAHERTGRDVLESFFARDLAVEIELFWRDEFDYWQMIWRWTQILTHRQNLAADFAQIVHCLKNLRLGFAEAEHDSTFRDNPAAAERKFFRASEHLQRRPILRPRAHHRREPLYRLHIVIVNVGTGIEHSLNAGIIGMKIRDEHFDDNGRIHFLDRSDHAGEMMGAAVFQIIASDGRDHDMFQFHSHDRFGHALRLVFLQGKRFRGCHRAKSTRACATVPRDHERGCALAPAFPAVRALRAFADGVQSQIGNERFGREENRIRRQTDFDPGRLMRLVQRRIDLCARHGGRNYRNVRQLKS